MFAARGHRRVQREIWDLHHQLQHRWHRPKNNHAEFFWPRMIIRFRATSSAPMPLELRPWATPAMALILTAALPFQRTIFSEEQLPRHATSFRVTVGLDSGFIH